MTKITLILSNKKSPRKETLTLGKVLRIFEKTKASLSFKKAILNKENQRGHLFRKPRSKISLWCKTKTKHKLIQPRFQLLTKTIQPSRNTPRFHPIPRLSILTYLWIAPPNLTYRDRYSKRSLTRSMRIMKLTAADQVVQLPIISRWIEQPTKMKWQNNLERLLQVKLTKIIRRAQHVV